MQKTIFLVTVTQFPAAFMRHPEKQFNTPPNAICPILFSSYSEVPREDLWGWLVTILCGVFLLDKALHQALVISKSPACVQLSLTQEEIVI